MTRFNFPLTNGFIVLARVITATMSFFLFIVSSKAAIAQESGHCLFVHMYNLYTSSHQLRDVKK